MIRKPFLFMAFALLTAGMVRAESYNCHLETMCTEQECQDRPAGADTPALILNIGSDAAGNTTFETDDRGKITKGALLGTMSDARSFVLDDGNRGTAMVMITLHNSGVWTASIHTLNAENTAVEMISTRGTCIRSED